MTTTTNTVNLDLETEVVALSIRDRYTHAQRVRLAYLLSDTTHTFIRFVESDRQHEESLYGNRSADNDVIVTFSDGSIIHQHNAGLDLYTDVDRLREACEGCDWKTCDQDSALTIYGRQEGWDK